MQIYRIPIKCSPQVVAVSDSAEVMDVTEPKKIGQLYLPEILFVCPRVDPDDLSLVNLTVHCVCVAPWEETSGVSGVDNS